MRYQYEVTVWGKMVRERGGAVICGGCDDLLWGNILTRFDLLRKYVGPFSWVHFPG